MVANAPLPSGYGRFGLTATSRLIDALRDGTNADGRVIVYSEAVQQAGFTHHSDFRTGDIHDRLPYYGVALERHIMLVTGEPSDPRSEEHTSELQALMPNPYAVYCLKTKKNKRH